MPLRIANLVSSSKEFQSRMDLFVVPFVQMGSSIPEFDLSELLTESQAMTGKVEKLCQKKGGSPEDLPTPSFRAYQWFKFLSERKWMLSHMYALLEFYDLLLELIPSLNKKNLYASIHIEIDHSGYLYRSRKQGRLVYLEINEGFINAPTRSSEPFCKQPCSGAPKPVEKYQSLLHFTGVSENSFCHAGESR
jgi:hypothetical protein